MSAEAHEDDASEHGPQWHFLVLAGILAAIALLTGERAGGGRSAASKNHATSPARTPRHRSAVEARSVPLAVAPPRARPAAPVPAPTVAAFEPPAEGAAGVPPEPSAAPPVENERAAAKGPIDRAAAHAALAEAAKKAAYCRRGSDPPGVAVVAVTFGSDGRVGGSAVIRPPFAGTVSGRCVAGRMRAAKVPPFEGKPTTIVHRVRVY